MISSAQFANSSARFGLPFLYPAQAQKEFFVNEAHALVDVLLDSAIEAELAAPPLQTEDGQSWLVAANATGEWLGKEGNLACRQAGAWLFIEPQDGLKTFDKSTKQTLLYASGWSRPIVPDSPSGGSTIDVEARAAFTILVEALRNAGIFPEST